VLRALKDLEFERSVGKISEEDYRALVAKYRAEGKRLIRALDEDAQPRRERVEGLVNERLHDEGLLERAPDPYRGPEPQVMAAKKAKKRKPARVEEPKAPEEPPDMRPACAACGTRNDADAVFCKKCGARQRDEEEEASESEPVRADQETTS
jgi:hypothetical protein